MNLQSILRAMRLFTALICLSVSSVTQTHADDDAAKAEFFESRIRPVLVQHCYECHNSSETSEGGLVVDHRDAMRKGGENGSVIVPGDAAVSRLLPILRHEVEGLEMPEGGRKLDEQTIADIAKWINDGAYDPRDEPPSAEEFAAETSWQSTLERRKQWWSFRPIADPELPPVINEEWSQAIDRFVLARLKQNDLDPAKPAPAATLVRRLFFNLLGLPPSPNEAKKWTSRIENASNADQRQQVVTALVDQLLDSPHFGERWARHWMDWIRYAESHGSEGDPQIANAWLYRDYLIRALNDDIPYDQLVREHIAGDLLDEPRVNAELGLNESAIATSHWRMVFHGFAPTDALDEKVRFTDDQINSFSKAFLGITVSCARCHNHKFDPISQSDYYALFGIFGSCRPGRLAVDTPGRLNKNSDLLSALKPQIRAAIAADWLSSARDIAAKLANHTEFPKEADSDRHLLHPLRRLSGAEDPARIWSELKTAYETKFDAWNTNGKHEYTHRWDFRDNNDTRSWFTNRTQLPQDSLPAGEFSVAPRGGTALTGVYPSGVYSHSVTQKHTARFTSPDFKLDEDQELWVRVIGDGGSSVRYVVQNYPRNGTVYPVSGIRNDWSWQRFNMSYWSGDDVHIELTTAMDAPLLFKETNRSWFGVRGAIVRRKDQPEPQDSFEHFEPLFSALHSNRKRGASYEVDSLAAAARVYQQAIVATVNAWQSEEMSDAQALFLDACLRSGLLPNALDALPNAKPLVEHYRLLEEAIPTPTRVPALDETVARDQPLFERGNHKRPMTRVSRRFLEAIDSKPYETNLSGRRELAEDLLRPDNPLTKRVIVNRIWHHLFGKGIVSTPDNLGQMGDQPSHPLLLDYLASNFERNEWSIKGLIRDIVLTNAWQQDAAPSDRALESDPENRLLSHANVRRLDAEAIRDSLLVVAGQLSDDMYGSPASGDSQRRSVYVRVIRNNLDPFLRVFDFPEPFTSVGRRDVTNVPAQSLTIMNDSRVAALAEAWARSTLSTESGDDRSRVASMFLTAFGRDASESEIDGIIGYLKSTETRVRSYYETQRTLFQSIAQMEAAETAITDPVRQRLLNERSESSDDSSSPDPIAAWDFSESTNDLIGDLHLELKGGAKVERGAAIVGNGAYLQSQRLQQSVRSKTLEAWVQLDNLTQRGGGVMTIQTPDGVTFDSIVFAEQQSKRWLAGSNGFVRTSRFEGADENEAKDRPVHVAITYAEDGTITGYRDGKPYGRSYKSVGINEFAPDQTIVTFGVRHLPNVDGRRLSGKIFRAHLYDCALSPEEIVATANSARQFVSDAKVVAALDAATRIKLFDVRNRIRVAKTELQRLGEPPKADDRTVAWTELAKALFTLKEFIYIR
ncbi:MAG: DUF1553 domain-containing protein [Planctomycetales bacterium]|nr:DUF1553 domain-containing protein [Planctomycetales bacterium]